MADSVIQICNNALVKLRSNLINSLDDNEEAAILCNQLYPIMRDALLRAHPWNFAMQRTILAYDVATPDFEYSYQYTLPADCLRVYKLYNTSLPYKIEGQKILSNETSLQLVYLKKETDPSKFDSMFSEVLAEKLASELAFPLTGSASTAQMHQQLYDMKLKMAKMVDAQENYADSIQTDTWIDSRINRAVYPNDPWYWGL